MVGKAGIYRVLVLVIKMFFALKDMHEAPLKNIWYDKHIVFN